MNIIFIVEISITILIVLVWLGPFLYSIRYRIFNFLHPQALIPIWIVYFVLNSMIEKWSPWMVEPGPGIIRTTELNLQLYPDYFIQPLLILLISGIFFHFGSRILSNSITESPIERIKYFKQLPVVENRSIIELSIITFVLISIAWIPNAMIPNEGLGTFWTYPLAMFTLIAPFILFKINRFLFFVSLIFVFLAISVLKSKAALIYPLLSVVIYYFYFNYRLKSFFSLYIPILIIIIFWLLLSLGGFDFVLAKLFHRDYQFDVFAALVHYSPNGLLGNAGSLISGNPNGPVVSWTLAELINSIPSIFNPYKGETINPAKLVSEYFLPEDFKIIPDSYFNRHLLFGGFYDLGLLGAMLSAFIAGFTYSFFWRITLKLCTNFKQLWPLFVYLPIPAISTYFVASGNIGYGFINSFIPAGLIFIAIFLSKVTSYYRVYSLKST